MAWRNSYQTPDISYETFIREIMNYERKKTYSFAALQKLKKELEEELGDDSGNEGHKEEAAGSHHH